MKPDFSKLNALYAARPAEDLLTDAAASVFGPRAALVSSFGAESVVLLDMAAQIDRAFPVLFIDTEMLFAETIQYQLDLIDRLGLTNVIRIRPEARETAWEDPVGDLSARDQDACCNLRKVRPLARALAGYDVSITGRKRHQANTRSTLDLVESDQGRIKINPLANWTREDIRARMAERALPSHPLVARGYPSIGCAPCTTPVAEGEDPRAGRWRGAEKTECGIHFIGGKLVRPGAAAPNSEGATS